MGRHAHLTRALNSRGRQDSAKRQLMQLVPQPLKKFPESPDFLLDDLSTLVHTPPCSPGSLFQHEHLPHVRRFRFPHGTPRQHVVRERIK
jgi:hypothetical protein